jgi:hypothetical protein
MAVRPDGKKGLYVCTSLIGGGTGALDALDITGVSTPNQYDLISGDLAIVEENGEWFFFKFDASGTDEEISPEIIRPDDYASAGVWRRCKPSERRSAVYDFSIQGEGQGNIALSNIPDNAAIIRS